MGSKGSDQPDASVADLELQHIGKRFGQLDVIHDLSLNVYKGELCCLLGPSGCGKTTTLKVIAGFHTPDRGQVMLGGRPVTHLPPQKRSTGMVFQNYALFPHINVFGNVAYGLRLRQVPRAEIKRRVRRMLSLVKLEGYEQRRISELSGGQQQRVALARALVIEPAVLLLDEPLSNLDARLRVEMRAELRRIQQALHITTIHVTHDQEEAMSIADRIALMNAGRIEQIGTPWEIYERPATRFAAEFVGHVNFVEGQVDGDRLWVLGREVPCDRGHGRVLCAIRPEDVYIGDGGPLSGVIRETMYLGSLVRYWVTLNGGPELMVEAHNPRLAHPPGTAVRLDFDPADVKVLKGFSKQ